MFSAKALEAQLALFAPAITGLADGDPVSTWADLSGNANDATASGGARPTYGVAQQGGQPSVLFDGANSYMTASVTVSQPATFIIVGKAAANGNFQYFIDGLDSSNRMAVIKYANNDVVVYSGVELAQANTWGNFQVWAAVFDGSSSHVHLNGQLFMSGDIGSQSVAGLTIGARYNIIFYLSGEIGSLIVANSIVMSALRCRIEQSLGYTFRIPQS